MKKPSAEANNFEQRLRSLQPEDFTGKTDFLQLSAEQKLAWLAAMVVFSYENTMRPNGWPP